MKVINLKKLYPYFAIIIASVFLVIFLNSVRETSTSPIKQKIVIIDAGHGTPDGGASAKDGTMEKDINLEIAKNHFNYAIKPQFVEIAIQEINLAQAQLDIALKRVKLLAPMQK